DSGAEAPEPADGRGTLSPVHGQRHADDSLGQQRLRRLDQGVLTMANPLQQLHAAGQSIWLDYIDRTMLHNGELALRIPGDALTGMTSNPTIFEKALAQGSVYDAQLKTAAGDRTAWEMFELVETDDVRAACDIFRPVYDAAKGRDGFV